MKQKYIIFIFLVVIVLVMGIVWMQNHQKEYPDDKNTLYSIQFNDVKIRFQRYDYSLGQNQIVVVEKSRDNGKTYEKLTDEPIIVSMEPKFIFLNQDLGFAISKSNLTKSNQYMGVKVTQDGGKTFIDGKINYNNPNIEMLTVEEVPYYDNDLLKLHCSIYQVKEDYTGYENIDLLFSSEDNGFTWNLELLQ